MAIVSLALLVPIVAFGQKMEKELFTLKEKRDEVLRYIEKEIDFEEGSDGRLLMEIGEEDALVIPWITGEFEREAMGGILENERGEMEEFEDVFAYEVPPCKGGYCYVPKYEKVTKERRRLFNRPMAVELVPKTGQQEGKRGSYIAPH